MGVLYDTYVSVKNKKHCDVCGCIMAVEYEDSICECCLDDLYKSEPGEEDTYKRYLH